MTINTKLLRIAYIVGIVALIVGALDPLEGSVIIAIGSTLVAFSTYFTRDRHSKIFMISAIMIVIGVFFLFFFSSLGGFGGTSTLSWWWGTLILPYPIGWLITIVMLVVGRIQKK